MFTETPATAEDEYIDGPDARPQGAGDVGVATPVDLAQRQRGALVGRQTLQRGPDGVALLIGHGHVLRRVPAGEVGVRIGDALVELRLRDLAFAQRVDAGVGRDVVKPASEGLRIPQAAL